MSSPATRPDQLNRRVVAQRLLDDAGARSGVLAQRRPVFAVAQHRQDRVGDQVHRRLVAGDQQQVAGRDDLFLGELVAGLLDRDQSRDQVVGGMRAPALQQVAQVVAQPQPGLQAVLEVPAARR